MEYRTEYAKDLLAFFRQSQPSSPPSLQKFAFKMGVSVAQLGEWARAYSDFSAAVEEAKLILQDKLIEWGLCRQCDATFAKFLLSEADSLWPKEMTDNHIEVRIRVTK